MGVYNNNKDGTRSTIANTIQVIDAPMEQFVSRDEFSAVVPNNTSANNKLVNDDKLNTKLNDIWKVQGELGAKNLLVYPYHKLSGETNGVTMTVNSNGSVRLNGTASDNDAQNTIYDLNANNPLILEEGTYVFSVNGLDASTMYADFLVRDSLNSWQTIINRNAINLNPFVITQQIAEKLATREYRIQIKLCVRRNQTVDNIIYPMIRLASDTDNTWQPYAPTNYQLNQKVDMTAGVYLPNATNINSKKVVASVGQTSVTFDANSFMSRYNVTASDLDLDISAKTASGDIVSYNNVSVTGGIVTVTFDALAEQTTFICKCSVIQ